MSSATTPKCHSLLLRGGTILFHEGNKVKVLEDCDLLTEGNKISKIGSSLNPPPGTRIVDCRNKIVSPGFIDTHRHLWQSQLKGRHGDETFLQYMTSGNQQSFNYTAKDIFWGQLSGCLESLDAGVTTVVDHAHMTYSADHANEGLRAMASSGLRGFFCYSPIERLKNWSSTFEHYEDTLPEWWTAHLRMLAKEQPFGSGRVHLGLGFDSYYLPKEKVVDLWKNCRSLGVRLITTHYLAHYMPDIIKIIAEYGLLKSDMIISHATGLAKDDAQLLVESGAYISSTPDTELQMGLGDVICFREDIKSNASIGIDCHSNNSADVITQIRLGMQHARGQANQTAMDNGGYAKIDIKLEEAFNLGTIQGARAVNMEDQIGSLAEGKLADIVVFDAISPSMVCAAQQNPLAAILLHSSVRDIHMVIVDGFIRKECGELCNVEILDGPNGVLTEITSWDKVAKELLSSRAMINERGIGQVSDAGKEALVNLYS